MDVQIAVEDAGDAYRWIAEDPNVTRHADVTLAPAARTPGTLGDPQLILAVVDTAVGLASLAVSLKTWADARKRSSPPAFHVTVNQIHYHSLEDLRDHPEPPPDGER